jgi:hypothetical protein
MAHGVYPTPNARAIDFTQALQLKTPATNILYTHALSCLRGWTPVIGQRVHHNMQINQQENS